MAITSESMALQNEKVRYSPAERCRTFFKVGATILALSLPAGDTVFGSQHALSAVPIRDADLNKRLAAYLRLDSPQITPEELESNKLTHFIVELSETANSSEGLSIKAYAAHLGRNERGQLAPAPGHDVYRIMKDSPLFISRKDIVERGSDNFPRLQLPGYVFDRNKY